MKPTAEQMITIYIITYNESVILPFTLSFYRKRFPDATVVIYDNFSTDNTIEIAMEHGCQVRRFHTDNEYSDQALVNIKNNCWLNAKTDWVIVCDADECFDIWPEDLKTDVTIFRSMYIEMVGTSIDPLVPIRKGVAYDIEGKFLCFNRTKVERMNYDYGCHTALPYGEIVLSKQKYPIYHYKYLSAEYVINRHQSFGKKLSKHNRRMKLSIHYLFSARKIRKHYEWLLKNAKVVLF